MKKQRIIPCKEYEEITLNFNVLDYFDFKQKYQKYLIFLSEFKEKSNLINVRIKIKHYIGIIALPNNQILEIKPKIPYAKFLIMLIHSNPDDAKIFSDYLHGVENVNFFDFFDLFLDDFLKTCMNVIMYHPRYAYKSYSAISNQIHGKLQLESSLNRSDFLYGKFMMEVDDLSLNIKENQLIKYVLLKILNSGLLYGSQIKKFRILSEKLKNVQYKQFYPSDRSRFHYNQNFIHYIKIHKICWFFIEHSIFGEKIGNKDSYSFLFNTWNIYEKFILTTFQKYVQNYTIRKNHPELANSVQISSNFTQNIPDIVISRDRNIIGILDTKYKKEKNFRTDAGQMLRYLREFTLLHKKGLVNFPPKKRKAILIYPSSFDNKDMHSNSMNLINPLAYDEGDEELGYLEYVDINLNRIDEKSYLKQWTAQIIERFI